jgi:rhamnosyltransferase
MKVCAIVVWYNPNEKMWDFIKKYLSCVDKCIIVDNSDKDNSNLIKSKGKKIIYLPNKDNLGIAKALNQGCELAKNLGFEWVLTMDQDSYFDKKNIKKYFEEAEKIYKENPKAVSFTVNYNKPIKEIVNKLDYVMTCGNLLKLSAWEKVKKFDEKLFIYWVDTIFGLRLKKRDYSHYEFQGVQMHHNILDTPYHIKLFGKDYNIRQDDYPLVKYYITRNFFEKVRIFGKEGKEKGYILRLIIKIIFFEHKKIEKLKMVYRGYRDFKKGKFGKYE